MNTDLDAYKSLLIQFGFKQIDCDSYDIRDDEFVENQKDNETSIYLGCGSGYSGFYSYLVFDSADKYISHGAAE